jgi:hypothetical protein
MWSLVPFGLAFMLMIAAVDWLLFPMFVSKRPEGEVPGRVGPAPRLRPALFPIWLGIMTVLGYAFVDRYIALSWQHGSDGPVFITCVIAGVTYEVVARRLPNKPHLTGKARVGFILGAPLGSLLWLLLHR